MNLVKIDETCKRKKKKCIEEARALWKLQFTVGIAGQPKINKVQGPATYKNPYDGKKCTRSVRATYH